MRITVCPAAECRHSAPREITSTDLSEVHAKLERVAEGHHYNYYHCNGWCKRIWRIERYDPLSEPYQEPEWIGYWDTTEDPELRVYEAPQKIMIDYKFLRSKVDPTRAAQNKRDARPQ